MVDILQEALARDKIAGEIKGNKITKKSARESVKLLFKSIHHYRDEYLRDPKAPYDHMLFREAKELGLKSKL